MEPVSNNSLTTDSVNWPYLGKSLILQSYTKYQQQRSTSVAKSCGLIIEKL